MKAQCDRCKEIVPLAFSAAAGGIDVTCPSCKASYFVAATAEARPGVTPMVVPASGPTARRPTMTCPKCGETQEPSPSCRRCGLVVEKWRGAVASADASTPSLEDAREAAALWTAVEEKWDDVARHDAFLAFCQRTTSYAFAATKYKGAQAAHPDAAARLKQVRALAEFALKRPGAAARPPSYRLTTLVVAAIFLVLAVGAMTLLFMRGQREDKRRGSPDAPIPTMKADPPR